MPNIARSHRLRIGRRSLANQIYHVTTATRDRMPYFEGFHVGRKVIRTVYSESSTEANTLALMVMPDHIHWMVQLPKGASLGGIVGTAKSKSADAVNDYLGRVGPVWQKGYYDRALRSDEDVVSVARYIIGNPIRAGIARSVGEYPLWDAVWV